MKNHGGSSASPKKSKRHSRREFLLRTGGGALAFAAIPTIARNAASPTDLTTLNKLRAACPARKEESPVDLQVALQILSEPHLYARAVHLADVPGQAAATTLTLPAASGTP